MKILVSACLLGVPCRYDGQSKTDPRVLALRDRHELIPICPEQLGGLSTPRAPSECRGERVIDENGQDNTKAFRRGAEYAALISRTLGAEAAVLKAKSPSCGLGRIYDGTFSGTLTEGSGVTAQALLAAGIPVYTENDLDHFPSAG